jgi:two-component system phosphate regulon response regulator PhoB
MARLFVIEDEDDLRQILVYNLTLAGHEVHACAQGLLGLAQIRQSPPDLLLLDLMLPDVSGLDICRQMKGEPSLKAIPILILTARGDEIDRIVGFELGADDYVAKPFSVRELLLRIQAILRRSQLLPTVSDDEDEINFGQLRILPAAHRVWVGGEEISLTLTEMKLLLTLYQRRGRVQSRGTLLDEVWEANPENNTRTVDTHIKRLREKLGVVGEYVETVRGVGYRFIDQLPENL